METSAAHISNNHSASDPSTCNTKTTCPYCGVGCGVIVKTQGEGSSRKIIQVVGDPDHPANYGKLCSKGSKLAETAKPDVYQQVRASVPLMRTSRYPNSGASGEPVSVLEPGLESGLHSVPQSVQPTSWDAALNHTAERFAEIIKNHGPDSVAFYISGQLLTEDYYAFNKLAKGLIGTNNIDTNSRLCMSSAVSGYKRTLGADAPPCSYEDLSLAQCVFIAGSNMAYAHPVAYRRLEAARAENPNHKLIVVDPRSTDTAQMADLHLQIQPGTDVMLFNAMLHVMLSERLIDPEYITKYTEGFDAVAKGVQEYTPELAASICGVKAEDIITAARWFALGGEAADESKPTISLYCQGLNQATTGTDKNTALIALHLATGQIGKAGAGPFSLTGQPNAMGGREVGGMATLLPGHRELANPKHVEEVANYWGVPFISNKPGATAVELFDRLEKGEIKAVWIACTNPAHSMPNSDKIKRALEKAEFVVVQDAYLSPATVQYADVLLPATTWAEKEGTVTNSERRISRVTPAVPAWAQARNDWQIVTQVAQLLEARLGDRFGQPKKQAGKQASMFNWVKPEELFNEHRGLTAGRDLDITGLTYGILESQGPQQWPMPEGATQGKPRLYEDGVFPTASGKAQFIWAEFVPVAEDADARFPWRLNTGRLRDHWHGSSRTGTLSEFFGHEPEPALALNPKDFARLGLEQGDWVEVKSRRSTLWWRAKADESVAMNQAYIPMHWGPEFTAGKASAGGVNAFTLDQFDPYSKQPELKHTALKVSKVQAPWECVIFVQTHQWLSLWLEARQLFTAFDSAVCVPFGRPNEAGQSGPNKPGLLFRAASTQAPDVQVLNRLEQLFQLAPNTPNLLTYSDPRTGSFRRIRVEVAQVDSSEDPAHIHLTGVMLAGQVQSEAWLRSYFDQAMDVTPVRSFLLSPNKQPAGMQVSAQKVVCNCVGVMESDIKKTIQAELTASAGATQQQSPVQIEAQVLDALKCGLRCGTQCGSCVPELKKMIKAEASKSAYNTHPVLLM